VAFPGDFSVVASAELMEVEGGRYGDQDFLISSFLVIPDNFVPAWVCQFTLQPGKSGQDPGQQGDIYRDKTEAAENDEHADQAEIDGIES
jgi:hypothetical protein